MPHGSLSDRHHRPVPLQASLVRASTSCHRGWLRTLPSVWEHGDDSVVQRVPPRALLLGTMPATRLAPPSSCVRACLPPSPQRHLRITEDARVPFGASEFHLAVCMLSPRLVHAAWLLPQLLLNSCARFPGCQRFACSPYFDCVAGGAKRAWAAVHGMQFLLVSSVCYTSSSLYTARGQAWRGRGSNSPRPSRYGPRRFGRRSKDVLYSTFFLFYLCAERPAKASASNCTNQRCNGEKTNVDHQLGHP